MLRGTDKSRAELLKQIEEQHKQILTYEKKLKDVVRAYKGLNAEKEALQATVEALSGQDAQEEAEGPSGDDESADAKGSISGYEAGKLKFHSTDERIETLKKSIATLTAEKARREAAFQADKKALLAENEVLKERIQKSADETEAQAERLEQHMKELRAKIKRIEGGRERELADHGSVLAEMQQRYAKERANCEQMERQIAELYKKLHEKEELPSFYESRISELSEELKNVKEEAEAWKKKAAKTPTVQMLESELRNFKEGANKEIMDLKSRLSILANEERETRLHELEERLHEMTSKLGGFERLRSEDRAKLEETQRRNEQLENDKALLLKSLRKENAERASDTESLTERLTELVEKLKRTNATVNLYEVLQLEEPSSEEKKRYEQLLDEFERYKLKAQAVLKSRNLAEESLDRAPSNFPGASPSPECASCASAEVDLRHMRSVIASLHEKLHTLEIDHANVRKDYEEKCAQMRETIVQMQLSQANATSELQQQMQRKVCEMETEMQKQRARTLDLLAEKEEELEVTKTILSSIRSQQMSAPDPMDPPQGADSKSQHNKSRKTRSRDVLDIPNSGEERRKSSDSSRIAVGSSERSLSKADSYSSVIDEERIASPVDGLTSFAFPSASNVTEARNMFYEQQIAKKDKNISELRSALRVAELNVREIQQSSLTKDLQHYEIIEKLKDEIRVLEGKLKLYSGNANMEYLRNVFVQLLHCESASGRKHILKAIGTVLNLCPNEMKTIDKHL